ncbi:FAD-binding oxidoreductase [Actinoplanes sp. KI2]|uniref:FAD-binding oxidoreductase n=1 Tax=Actinoplanes sp. KI2 TaxID=2983315 RepID=UPI0021D5A7EC|nr:FAD-binding oxidoreductase [Actinoplanes sp. KI2]MCU7722824.1 FAD-binding oxidoreductase [Actinoplanes sp. KI2]
MPIGQNVRCATATEVAEVIALARRKGLACAVRSGGHCFAGRSSTGDIVIDVSPMRAVSVDGDSATVGAGTRLCELYRSLAEHDRTVPAGCGPTVGIAGLTLGGGLGILGRSRGLTCDNLRSATVVLADGRTVDCDERRHADLFWALRGAGGGQFGVVTSLTFRIGPAPPATTFHLTWRPADAVRVIGAWQEWAPGGPDELAASLLVTVDGATMFGTMLDTESTTATLIGDFVARAGAEPLSAVTRHLPFHDAKRDLDRAADAPTGHTYSKSGFFGRRLPEETIAALVDHLTGDRVPGQARELDFTPWGGAYNRVPVDATAFAHRDALFLLKHSVTGEQDSARRWLAGSHASVHAWGTGGVYPNFPDPDLTDWATAYHGPNYPRLQRVKARYDPAGFFRFHQAIRPGDAR